jgi:hypothetical protein
MKKLKWNRLLLLLLLQSFFSLNCLNEWNCARNGLPYTFDLFGVWKTVVFESDGYELFEMNSLDALYFEFKPDWEMNNLEVFTDGLLSLEMISYSVDNCNSTISYVHEGNLRTMKINIISENEIFLLDNWEWEYTLQRVQEDLCEDVDCDEGDCFYGYCLKL